MGIEHPITRPDPIRTNYIGSVSDSSPILKQNPSADTASPTPHPQIFRSHVFLLPLTLPAPTATPHHSGAGFRVSRLTDVLPRSRRNGLTVSTSPSRSLCPAAHVVTLHCCRLTSSRCRRDNSSSSPPPKLNL
ncbi:hypothetical protein PIB30_045003 [Stylosanthes scabra]|uniref:Uncharacterized protein n=1 Tax=Stylosanthes scabra TaxID=79078 RepID=A0ABU6YGH4_9FABA|nr:hypothetical protein [Stylosanthes scabra]